VYATAAVQEPDATVPPSANTVSCKRYRSYSYLSALVTESQSTLLKIRPVSVRVRLGDRKHAGASAYVLASAWAIGLTGTSCHNATETACGCPPCGERFRVSSATTGDTGNMLQRMRLTT